MCAKKLGKAGYQANAVGRLPSLLVYLIGPAAAAALGV